MLPSNDFSRGADNALACIFSLSGLTLTSAEKTLFRAANPFGFILFKRNCETPDQVSALVAELKSILGRNCPVLIDQEGGRVQRLKPPHWRGFPAMRYFGELYQKNPEHALEELRFETLRLAEELIELGINVNCAPVLDVCFDGAHDIVGDRSFSSDPAVVARLGLSVCRHFLSVGITPIIKHIPGHGRASADSHLELPCVDAPYDDLSHIDFEPFKSISASDVGASIWAMTAHVKYKNIDPDRPVSISDYAIESVVRRDIGFEGVLIGDDLDMKALDSFGGVSQKALKSLKAGCDLALYCAGEIEKMQELADNLPKINEKTRKRLQKAALYGNVAAS